MGEIADMILEGFLDEQTGEYIDGDSPGFPRTMQPGHYNTIRKRPFSNGNKRNGAKKWLIKQGFKHNFKQVVKIYCNEMFPSKNFSSEKQLLVCGGDEFQKFSTWVLKNKEQLNNKLCQKKQE